jgi:hypothetical protein
MGDIEPRSLGGDELVDVRAVADEALAESHVEVARNFVNHHAPRDLAAFPRLHVGVGVACVPQTLLRGLHDHGRGPPLGVVCQFQLVARVATLPCV